MGSVGEHVDGANGFDVVVLLKHDHFAGEVFEVTGDVDDAGGLCGKNVGKRFVVHAGSGRIEDNDVSPNLHPIKALRLTRLQEMLKTCALPQDCKTWIDKISTETVTRPPYATIVNTISQLQAAARNEPVQYGELRNELKHCTPPVDYQDLDELKDICKRMAGLAPNEITATEQTVELDQSAHNVIAAIESATKEHLASSHPVA